MLIHAPSTTTPSAHAVALRPIQKVLVVNGDSQGLESLEPMLAAGHYDVVFVEASGHAYSQVKRLQPDLVILCLKMDAAAGFQVLSMLKLDAETRDIPLVTHMSPAADEEESVDPEGDEQTPMFAAPPALVMN